jgi:hypothetical protein
MASRNCIRKIVDVNLSKREVYRMCREHGIRPQHFRCFWRFAARAEILAADFGRRIVLESNYKELIDKILVIVDGVL